MCLLLVDEIMESLKLQTNAELSRDSGTANNTACLKQSNFPCRPVCVYELMMETAGLQMSAARQSPPRLALERK